MKNLQFVKHAWFSFQDLRELSKEKGEGENYLGKGYTLMYLQGTHIAFFLPFFYSEIADIIWKKILLSCMYLFTMDICII